MFTRGETIQITSSRFKFLIRKHGSMWMVTKPNRYTHGIGIRIKSLDGKHERNIRVSDVTKTWREP